MSTLLRRGADLLAAAVAILVAGSAAAQPPPHALPVPAAAPPSARQPTSTGTLRVHIVSTQGNYLAMGFDVFSAESRAVVAFGRGADESTGQPVPSWDLAPGLYKIVRSGEPFEAAIDFATVDLEAGEVIDLVIAIDPDTLAFRGSGPVTGELPRATEIAGIRLALDAGGSLELTNRHNLVGGTSGVTALIGLFGHFSLVFDRDNHFAQVTSDLDLTLNDLAVASISSTQDRWEAAALYAYNFNNPYVGPYARGSFKTRVFPGYLYLDGDGPVTVNIARTDGTMDTQVRGDQANQDDLRIRVARSFAPFVLQEEVGANLKAVSLDLVLLKLTAATRLGFGLRQGITNDLLVVAGDERGDQIDLVEVDSYDTLGPVIGADATATFARWLFGSARFGMMVPVSDTDAAGDGFGDRLLIDLAGTGGLRLPALTSFLFASFDYSFRLQKDGYITSELQFDHTLMARINLSIL
ncbi:MAG TPA: hypothetical protein VK698_30085 [Kofleriaceae bacterium]|nr:hypothetical protein [Kofleriaceae bacterium]